MMFGLTKREQRWKAEQKAAEVLIPAIVQLTEARLAMDTNERIVALEAELAKVKAEVVSASEDSLRLIDTIKYLRGIAERGEARTQRDDETVEAFVLDYVKRLEAERDAAVQDAERYRWLRDIGDGETWIAFSKRNANLSAQAIDAAIDAARARSDK